MQEDLALVIPVWNLPEDLSALLRQVADLGVFTEVIVSDDGSSENCDPRALGFTDENLGAKLVYLRSDKQKGAGHARNIALKQVTAGNLLFFDADDQLTPDFARIWAQHLKARAPDLTIFRHTDTRVRDHEEREGTFLPEEALWDRAMGQRQAHMLTLDDRATLSTISAYPWNKIYRTGFLREHNITCSETPVHNDIRLHWLSFVHARDIQATRTLGAVHVIGERGHHLTTRRGTDRLCLQNILSELTRDIRAAGAGSLLMQNYIHFVDNVCRWNLNQIEGSLAPQFRALAKQAYLDFQPDEFNIFARARPAQAKAIVDFLLKEGA